MSLFRQHVAEIPSIKKKNRQFFRAEPLKDELSGLNITALKKIARERKIPYYSDFRKGDEEELRKLILENASTRLPSTTPRKKATPKKKATRTSRTPQYVGARQKGDVVTVEKRNGDKIRGKIIDISSTGSVKLDNYAQWSIIVEAPIVEAPTTADNRRNNIEDAYVTDGASGNMAISAAINAEKLKQLEVLKDSARLKKERKTLDQKKKVAAMQEGVVKKFYIDMREKLISQYKRLILTILDLGDEDEWLNQIERVPDSEQGLFTTTKVSTGSPVAKMLSALSETVKTIISSPYTPENVENALEGRSGSGWSSRIASWWKGGRKLFPSPGSTCVGAGRGDWFCGLTRQLNRQHVVRFVSDCENLIREWDPSLEVPTLNKTYKMIDERDSLIADKKLLRTKWATCKITGAMQMKKLRNNLESIQAERDDAVQESDQMEERITGLLNQIEEQQEKIEEQQKAAAAAEARAKKVEEENSRLNKVVYTLEDQHEEMQARISDQRATIKKQQKVKEENSRLNKVVSTLEDQHEEMQATISDQTAELENQADELNKIHTKLIMCNKEH